MTEIYTCQCKNEIEMCAMTCSAGVVRDAKDLCAGHQRAGQKRPFVQTGTRIEANRRTVKQKVRVQMTPG